MRRFYGKHPFTPIPRTVKSATIKTVPSIEDCPDCQGQAELRALTKNKNNINKTINRHRYEVHGIPYPRKQQQQSSKKSKISRGAGGPPSDDEESNHDAIDGFVFKILF